MGDDAVTRGGGLLERFLADRRARMANRLIPDSARSGKLLDIGCGSYPYFLSRTAFAEKLGLDKQVREPKALYGSDHPHGSLSLMGFDIDQEDVLPFEDETFHAVTMLAVFEHIRRDRLPTLLNEIARVLRESGVFIMTTPAGFTGPILRGMAALRLVSGEEIREHEHHYSCADIREVFLRTEMAAWPTRFGRFELGMNSYAVVKKPDHRRVSAHGPIGWVPD